MAKKTKKGSKDKVIQKKAVKTKRNFSIDKFYPCIIGAIFVLVYLYIFDDKIDLNGDNAYYYNLAKSIAAGKGYIQLNSIYQVPHGRFPPGYPLLLAPFTWISTDISFLKAINGFFMFVGLLVCFRIMKMLKFSSWSRWLVILTLICNYYLLKYSTIMMSEIPLIFCSLTAVYLLIKEEESKSTGYKITIAVAIVASIAFHIKTLAIALPVGVVLHYLLNRHWQKSLVFFGLFLLLLLPFKIRNANLGIKSTYTKQLLSINPYNPNLGKAGVNDFLTRVKNNTERYISKEIPNAFFATKEFGPNEKSPSWYYILGAVSFIFILYGLFSLQKLKLFFIGYLGSSMVILLLWPDVWFGIRFMLGVVPLLTILLYFGLEKSMIKLSEKYHPFIKHIPSVVLLIILIGQTGLFTTDPQVNTISKLYQYAKQPYPKSFKNFFDLGKWTKQNIPAEDVIASRKPALYYLFDGGFTAGYNRSPKDDKAFFESLNKEEVKYVVIGQLGYGSTSKVLVPMVNKYPERFKVVKKIEDPDTYLLEYLPADQ